MVEVNSIQSVSGRSYFPQRGFLALFTAGMLAACGGWYYIDRFFLYEDPLPAELVRILEASAPQPVTRRNAQAPAPISNERRAEMNAAFTERRQHYWRSQVKQSALAVGVFGLCLGGFLAFAESIGRRNLKTMAIATLGTGVLGAAFGAAGGVAARYALTPLFFRSGQHPMVVTMIVHMICWSCLAVGIGLSYRWGCGGTKEAFRNAIACVLGGIVAALLFTPICSYWMPINSTVPLVPEESYPRMLWIGLAGVAIATFPAIVATRPIGDAARVR